MIVRPAEIADIPYIVANLSAQNASEFDALGVTDEFVCAQIGYWLGTNKGETATIDGRPVCVFGYIAKGNRSVTWFLATTEYFMAGLPAVRHARRYLETMHKNGFGDLWTRTFSNHPDVKRWFRALGYEPAEDGWFVHRG